MHKDQNLICLASIAGRNETVFSKINREYSDLLFKLLIRVLPDEGANLDAIQETFITFWEHKVKMQKVISIKAYLFRLYALGLCRHFAQCIMNHFGEQYRNTLLITARSKFFSVRIK